MRTDSVYQNFEKRYIYGNGLVYRQITSEKAGEFILTFPQTSLKEIFLLYNILYNLEDGAKYKDDGYATVSKSNLHQIDLYIDICTDIIRQIKWTDTVIVSGMCSC